MSVYRVQCSGCGYLTQFTDTLCPRCGTPLSLGNVIGDAGQGATIYTGGDTPDEIGWDQTEAFGSLPSVKPLPPAPSYDEGAELPAISSPEPQPVISMSGDWDSPPAPVGEMVISLGEVPRDFQPTTPQAAEAQPPAPVDQPWTMSAPPVPEQPEYRPRATPPGHPDHPPTYPPEPPQRQYPSQQTSYGPPASMTVQPRKRISAGLVTAIAFLILVVAGFGVLIKMMSDSGTGRLSTGAAREKYVPILENQPDFSASLSGTENGGSVSGKCASLGDDFLMEANAPKSWFLGVSASGTTPVVAILHKDDKITVISHEFWFYMPTTKSQLGIQGLNDPFSEVAVIAAAKTTTITEAGTEQVGDFETNVLLLSQPGAEPVQVNIAPALGNLIVKLDIPASANKAKTAIHYTLSNVSLTVDPEMFRVPTSYKKVGE